MEQPTAPSKSTVAAAETPTSKSNKADDQHDAAKAAASNVQQRRLPAHALPIRQYLESTVVPILMSGLQSLCRERPEDPVEYLASYLLQHNPKKNGAAAGAGGGGVASDSVQQPAPGQQASRT